MKAYIYKFQLKSSKRAAKEIIGLAIAATIEDLFWVLDESGDPYDFLVKEVEGTMSLDVLATIKIFNTEYEDGDMEVTFKANEDSMSEGMFMESILEGVGWKKVVNSAKGYSLEEV